MTTERPRIGDHPAALIAWVVAVGSALIGIAAAFIGPHEQVPWEGVLFPVMFGVPGALIASQIPRIWVGWLMLAIASGFATNTVAGQYLAAGAGPHADWWAWWVGRGGGALLVPATLLLILLLPDGRFPSPRWRLAVMTVVSAQVALLVLGSITKGPAALDETVRGVESLANPLGLLPDSWNEIIVAAVDPTLVLPFLLGIPMVVTRLRTAGEDVRPRAAGILVSVFLFVLLVTVPDIAWPAAAPWFHIAGAALLTGSILVAVLRGEFEQVEIVISRALVYGLLTVVVGAVYVGVVALAANVGLNHRFAGAITALVAIGLLPARQLVQAALRRVIYGDVRHPDPPGTQDTAVPTMSELSKRENEILGYVAQGLTNAETAAELFISPITVRNHVSSILVKLDVSNRTQAVVKYQETLRE